MSEVCKKHVTSPARIYHQCIGCEIEWYEQKTKEQEAEIERLKIAIHTHESYDKTVSELNEQLNQVNDVLKWIKNKYEEEWTYELGTGEVVSEIIAKLEEALGGESNDPQTSS